MVQGRHIFDLLLFETLFSHERIPLRILVTILLSLTLFPMFLWLLVLYYFSSLLSPPTSLSIIVSNLYRFIT